MRKLYKYFESTYSENVFNGEMSLTCKFDCHLVELGKEQYTDLQKEFEAEVITDQSFLMISLDGSVDGENKISLETDQEFFNDFECNKLCELLNLFVAKKRRWDRQFPRKVDFTDGGCEHCESKVFEIIEENE